MDEETIKKLYIEKPDEEVKLLCSYATRREGFLDILLSRCILSSEEAEKLLGTIKTHRGNSMTTSCRKAYYYSTNDYISFSTGFVSFKYSDPSLKMREDYVGGFGVLLPLESILKYPYLGFSHCSDKGGIENFDLNKENIRSAVHITRKQGALYDDGYGNLFEIALKPKLKIPGSFLSSDIISYPRLELTDNVIVAIPENEREEIVKDLLQRQKEYMIFLEKMRTKSLEEWSWETVEGREVFDVKEMVSFIEGLVQPFEFENLPIIWYKERNFDLALQRLAITQGD